MLLFGLIPPEIPWDDNGGPTKEAIMEYRKAKRRWNYAVATALWLMLSGGTVFTLWAVQLIPRTSGLAFAEEVRVAQQQVAQKIDGLDAIIGDLAQQQLETRLMENRRHQCQAIKDNDALRKETYANLMQELKTKYVKLTGGAWDEPECEAL